MSKRRALILFLVMAVSLLGLFACSTRQIVDLALSKHPDQMLKSMAESRAAAYKYNPELALTDIKRVKQEFDRLMGNLQKESGAQWGKKEAEVLPTKTRYVKYTEQYKNRVVVDYDAGTILIEHLDGDKAREKLRNAAVIALLTPDDPSAVDLFSDK